MLSQTDIISIALREHPDDISHADREERISNFSVEQHSPYSKRSAPLSIVSFRCFLQDTGYPMEVYMPTDDMDMSKLQERWVGWGVQ
jgi:hypothetical protein